MAPAPAPRTAGTHAPATQQPRNKHAPNAHHAAAAAIAAILSRQAWGMDRFSAPGAVLFCGTASIAGGLIFTWQRRSLNINDRLARAQATAGADSPL